ncbi:hypothetical protein F5Y11DRAFT_319319 [Daldinia sp. FL1419]|nr:hypothetical protein F5Y11DRAFT_319319 [Daldinia sp. FL1419]
METNTFHPFPMLPLRIRLAIWRKTLPKRPKAGLVFWKSGCWRGRLVESSVEYDCTPPGSNDTLQMELRFHHEFLDTTLIYVPIFHVDHEARGVASMWLIKNQVNLAPRGRGYIFRRPFYPRQDALYILPDRWKAFDQETVHYDQRQINLWGDIICNFHPVRSAIERLALPLRIISDKSLLARLPYVIHQYNNIREIVIIFRKGAPYEEASHEWKLIVWEENFIWNHRRREFEYESDNKLGVGSYYKPVRDYLTQTLRNPLALWPRRSLVFKPGTVVRGS